MSLQSTTSTLRQRGNSLGRARSGHGELEDKVAQFLRKTADTSQWSDWKSTAAAVQAGNAQSITGQADGWLKRFQRYHGGAVVALLRQN